MLETFHAFAARSEVSHLILFANSGSVATKSIESSTQLCLGLQDSGSITTSNASFPAKVIYSIQCEMIILAL